MKRLLLLPPLFAAMPMAVLLVLLGYFTWQPEFGKIIACGLPCFLIYLFACRQGGLSPSHIRFYLFLAIFLRFLLLFAPPRFSNDVYRFLWDGRLLLSGHSPFEHLPTWYLEEGHEVPGLNRQLFEAFGAKVTYSCYPPLAQAQFFSGVWLFPDDIFWSTIVMKFWLFLFEMGSIYLIIKLLQKFQLPPERVLLYALNPLILLEIMGNLHFEGAMIFFLLLAIWLLVKCGHQTPNTNYSSVAFALSIGSKLLTAMFLPFLVKRMGWKISLRYFFITGLATALLFLPVINPAFFSNFSNSLGLYFQKLEFNASLFYLLRWVGWQVKGYNVIASLGPALGLLAAAGILALAFFEKNATWKKLPEKLLFAFCLYLLCATTVHPWYLALPVVLCVFTRWRFPIVWSGLIYLTYINYSYQPYRENLWVVGMEYTAVALWLVWEWKTNQRSETPLTSHQLTSPPP